MVEIPEEVVDLIKGKPLIASFATSVDEQPHVAPVWYNYEDGKIQISKKKKKAKNAKKNPKVALSIEKNKNGIPKGMVTFQGTAEIKSDKKVLKRVNRNIYSNYLGEDMDEWNELYRKQVENPSPNEVIIEIKIETFATSVTGS